MICRAAPDSGSGGMPGGFEKLTQQGMIVGYSLMQDDELDIEVHVGDPFTDSELAIARWLDPQHALLQLPSGRLCVESNDASRVGPEEPTDKGAQVDLPAGDYMLTLYRIDYEALSREKLDWRGPQEVIVLTPGGTKADAAADLLPFQPRRDTTWIGKYQIKGQRAEALAWFHDYWDTFVVNLDLAAASRLSLTPGKYFRTHVPTAKITLISSFGKSWTEAQRLRPPADIPLDEYGYAAFSPMSDWDGAEALFCRRERAKTRIEDEQHNLWLPAVVEVLDAKPIPPREKGSFEPSDLAQKQYYDSGFLGLILSDLLPEAAAADELTLPMALVAIGKKLAKFGYAQQGDLQWAEETDEGAHEFCFRLYAGKDGMAIIFACAAFFDLLFVTGYDDGTWLVTGLADDFENLVHQARAKGAANTGIAIQCLDEDPGKIAEAHRMSLRQSKKKPATAPANMQEGARVLEQFLKTAFEIPG
ncbi:MAG: hypothetical protein ACRESK_07470 [Gammaproteobacteria bacterium]